MSSCSSSDEADGLLKKETELARSLRLRPLTPADLPSVQALCAQSFPIEYPQCWFDEVVSGSLISLGLFEEHQLAAMIVAETKTILHCNFEDRDIVSDSGAHVVYILSLASARPYRRMGLATRLLRHLLDTVIDHPPYSKAVFLHVLSTNTAAIKFYKNNGFYHHDTLLNYYRLQNGFGDGCTYVLYTNGGRRPFSFGQLCRSVGSALCFPIKMMCRIFVYS